MATTEARVINSILKNKDVGTVVSEGVDKFFSAYSDVWDTIHDYWKKYQSAPSIEIVKEQHPDFVVIDTGSDDTKFFVDRLREEYLKNRLQNLLMDSGSNLKKRNPMEILESITSEIYDIQRNAGVVRDLNVVNYKDAIKDYEDRKKRLDEYGASGIMMKIAAFDEAYPTGLAGGHLIVVIGWSGYGKSWFTSYMACQAWLQGFKPMIVSLEMSPEQVRDRIYTILGSGMFSNRGFSKGDVVIDRFNNWGKSNLQGKQDFVIVSNQGNADVTVNTVQAKIDQYQPDIVIADYHQLFGDAGGSQSEVLRNRNISRDFKLLAVRNNIPIVDITQATQSDTSSMDEPPLISQVAWSKGIQHDADLAIAVHKDPMGDEMMILGRKNRHGPLFGFILNWDIDKGEVRITTEGEPDVSYGDTDDD